MYIVFRLLASAILPYLKTLATYVHVCGTYMYAVCLKMRFGPGKGGEENVWFVECKIG
jgi:hypothetical protein